MMLVEQLASSADGVEAADWCAERQGSATAWLIGGAAGQLVLARICAHSAPTAIVLLLIDTVRPKRSSAPALGALTKAWAVHVLLLRTKMYTAPAKLQSVSVGYPLAPLTMLVEQLDSPCAPMVKASPSTRIPSTQTRRLPWRWVP